MDTAAGVQAKLENSLSCRESSFETFHSAFAAADSRELVG